MFKINNTNTSFWLVSLLLTLNIFHTFLLCFYCRTGNCLLGVHQNDSIPIVTVVVVMKS